MNKDLEKLLDAHAAFFYYDEATHIWYLSGYNKNRNPWETDDFNADSLEQAEADAISFLTSLKEE
jgi:hypothetical protein